MNTSRMSGKTSAMGSQFGESYDGEDSENASMRTKWIDKDPVFKELDEFFQALPDNFNEMRQYRF